MKSLASNRELKIEECQTTPAIRKNEIDLLHVFEALFYEVRVIKCRMRLFAPFSPALPYVYLLSTVE